MFYWTIRLRFGPMYDVNDIRFEPVREWMKRKRARGDDWNSIESFKNRPDFFQDQIIVNDWPEESESAWDEIVAGIQAMEERRKEIRESVIGGTLHGPGQSNELTVPTSSDSCWIRYRKKLEDRGFTNIDVIQEECLTVLNSLSSNTIDNRPVKGMVVGYVQSGKTANMAGLISMAADHGWNMFIVLSGTINSLKEQTSNRLYNDLNDEECRLNWHPFDYLSPNRREADPRFLEFQNGSSSRYLNVCLKNKKRLTDLLKWLNMDPIKKRQMKILLIDDEADQASINTQKPDKERRAVNDLIVKIVECLDNKKNKSEDYGAMNYVSYTATPYANFLSEGTPASLYPRDFVLTLTPPNLYFGPKQVFGRDIESFSDISPYVDTCIDTDSEMARFYESPEKNLPDGLKDSVAWFLCCVAIMRRRCSKKPVSMLVHTSALTENHRSVAISIYNYMSTEKNELFNRAESVYAVQTSRLSKSDFLDRYGEYERSDSVEDYPPFSDIRADIEMILGYEIQHIKIDEEEKIVYGKGIHLCIDNSKNDIIDDDENSLPRLIYPGKDLDFDAPAFLVVGGNTLSRGLTIEGLVSSYFARSVTYGDTLMQMGRWFGYRIGYELLPRIWMSKTSADSFVMLSDVDESLRDFIRDNYSVLTPEQLPPMVKKFPKTGFLKSVTSPSKMRAAVITGADFAGCTIELTCYDSDITKIRSNLNVAEDFINMLKKPTFSTEKGQIVWRDVSGETIFNELISKYNFSVRQKNFYQYKDMKTWIMKKGDFYNWSVILAGPKKPKYPDDIWTISDDIKVGKIVRTRKSGDSGQVVIGMLSDPADRIADVDLNVFNGSDELKRNMLDHVGRNWREIRDRCGCRNVPAIIVYRISKDSAPNEGSKTRFPLNVGDDLIGLTILMPGIESNSKGFYQIPSTGKVERCLTSRFSPKTG